MAALPNLTRNLKAGFLALCATALATGNALARDQAGSFPGIFPVSFFKTGGLLNSDTQYVEVTIAAGATSGTATITAVGSLAFIVYNGETTPILNGNTSWCRVELTNSTTVTALRNTLDASDTVTARVCVVDPKSGLVSSVQQGTIALTATNATNTATISSVDTARSIVIWLGFLTSNTTAANTSSYTAVDLTDATTVTATRNATSNAVTVGYVVVQFASGIITSVQKRSVTMTTNATTTADTISAVTTANTVLFYNGVHSSVGAFVSSMYRLELTSTTNVNLTRTGASTTTKTVKYTVCEFASGVLNSLQRNTTSISGATSADTAVSAVTVGKTLLMVANYSTTGSTVDESWPSGKLNSTTQVRGQKNTAVQTSVIAWTLAEFV